MTYLSHDKEILESERSFGEIIHTDYMLYKKKTRK